jgi:CheY-like chemotaxis protein
MQKKILIIEDNRDIRESTTELLELEGYAVLTTENGLEGIRSAQAELPDLVICDVLMEGADGYTVFRALLGGEDTRHIPFIFVTAKSESTDKAKAMAIGPCGYLVKPFDEKELFACISRCLAGIRREA